MQLYCTHMVLHSLQYKQIRDGFHFLQYLQTVFAQRHTGRDPFWYRRQDHRKKQLALVCINFAENTKILLRGHLKNKLPNGFIKLQDQRVKLHISLQWCFLSTETLKSVLSEHGVGMVQTTHLCLCSS